MSLTFQWHVVRSILLYSLDARRPTNILFTDRADLAAYLATRRQVRVYIRVGSSRADSGDDRGKVTSRELLGCLRPGYDVCGCDHPVHAPLLRALRSKAGRIGITGRLAQKYDDAAAYTQLADMDMGLSYLPL